MGFWAFAAGGAGADDISLNENTFSARLNGARQFVFWPPALVLIAALAASLINFNGFLDAAKTVHEFLLDAVGPLFLVGPLAAVVLMAIVFISPLGAVRIGGADAQPILTRWNWFAIALCTTIATGILFWGAAEPIFHLKAPPAFSGAEPHSADGARFAMSTLYLHWSFTPYAIYGAPALAFALAYYNLGGAYSLSAPLSLALGGSSKPSTAPLARGGAAAVDAIALFALVAGVAASLGAGMMTLADGLGSAFGLDDGPLMRLAVTIVIVGAFIASSVSGLQRGIRLLSDLNIRLFFALAAFVFVAGPTGEILSLAGQSVIDYARTFFPRSLGALAVSGEGAADRAWVRDWTMYSFANWAAWAPITALFLGRIAVGYSVREFILFTMALPALFGIVWMSIFGGAALNMDLAGAALGGENAGGGPLTAALTENGAEAAIYAVFAALPLSAILIAVFLLTTFISFVTAMDSNTHSIASVCLKARRQSDETKGAGLWIKVFWGVLIGAVAWIMTATSGVDGVRMLSNLGGAPGLLILLGSMAALARLVFMTDRLKTGSRAD